MFKLDANFLDDLGLGTLSPRAANAMLRAVYEHLESAVGLRLASRMSDEQLDHFEKFIDANDEKGALRWLETNFPDYKDVVAETLEDVKGEARRDRMEILSIARARPPEQFIRTLVRSNSSITDAMAEQLFLRIGTLHHLAVATEAQLQAVPGVGRKLANEIRGAAIAAEESRGRLEAAVREAHLPPETSRAILEHYGSAEDFGAAADDELLALRGVGPIRLQAMRRQTSASKD